MLIVVVLFVKSSQAKFLRSLRRCKIPECDIGVNNRELRFDQPWLKEAIPYPLNKMDKCQRYVPRNGTTNADGQCSADFFDNTKLMECSEFIYSSDEKNVQTEVRHNFMLKLFELNNFVNYFNLTDEKYSFSSEFTVLIPINWL